MQEEGSTSYILPSQTRALGFQRRGWPAYSTPSARSMLLRPGATAAPDWVWLSANAWPNRWAAACGPKASQVWARPFISPSRRRLLLLNGGRIWIRANLSLLGSVF